MAALILAIIIAYAIKKAAEEGHLHWQSSKAANRRSTRGRPVRKRAASAVQHDVGYWIHEVTHGFPRARHGLASGWHAGRTAQIQGTAARQQAKTEHLETRAGLIQQIRDHRQRQEKALEQIRAAQQPEPAADPEGGEGRQRSPAPQDGLTYGAGWIGSPYDWPVPCLEDATTQARRMGTAERPWRVTEYPADGGPGRTVATYAGGKPIAATVPDAMPCDLCDKPLPPGYAGIAHPECINALESLPGQAGSSQPAPSSQTTEGNTMPTGTTSGDTTYTQQLQELQAIRRDAEEEVNSVRMKRMLNRLDVLTSLGLDSATLSEAAEIDDALREQQKAAQQTLDAADAAIHGLTQRHGGIQEAVDSSPVSKPAEPEFYQN